SRNAPNQAKHLVTLGRVGNLPLDGHGAVVGDDLDAVVPELGTLTELVRDGVGQLLIGGISAGRERLAGLNTEPARLAVLRDRRHKGRALADGVWQNGVGHPQSDRGGQHGKRANGHGILLVIVGAASNTQSFPAKWAPSTGVPRKARVSRPLAPAPSGGLLDRAGSGQGADRAR